MTLLLIHCFEIILIQTKKYIHKWSYSINKFVFAMLLYENDIPKADINIPKHCKDNQQIPTLNSHFNHNFQLLANPVH